MTGTLLFFAVARALWVQRAEPESPVPASPSVSPFGDTIAGLGVVESSTAASDTANIAIGSQVAGVVRRVNVQVGQEVQEGELLFALDDRQALADLHIREAALHVAKTQLRRLQLQPRPEEVPASEAQLEVARQNLRQAEDLYLRDNELVEKKAVSEEEFMTRQLSYRAAEAQVTLAQANLTLLKAGAWAPDIAIAEGNVEQAAAEVNQVQTALDILQVRAPINGAVLRVNARPGEFISSMGGQSLVVMGNIHPLHVRVSIDEEDLPRLKINGTAQAKLRGDPRYEAVKLVYVRREIVLVPKTSLTGVNTERVDTRVAQLIYAVDPDSPLMRDKKLLVGQVLDVFIDAK